MLRNAGVSEPETLPVDAFKGGCCKMFLQLNETVGTSVFDAIGGLEFPTTAIEFSPFANTIALDIYSGVDTGTAPVAGNVPTAGTKDFILFEAHRFRTAYPAGRPECLVTIGDPAGDSYGFYDGDAHVVTESGLRKTKTDCFLGMSPYDTSVGSIACVRDGRKIGTWVHNSFPENANDLVADGGIFCETSINDHVVVDNVNPTTEYYSGYDIDPSVNYTTYSGLGNVAGGFPDVWALLPEGYSMPYTNTLTVGRTNIALNLSVARYGLALFVFDGGLPADWKEALRWMRDQWISGNKVIWPDWVSVA
ncbi:MAG: hypothetical protein OEY89_12055 [Gammaproteobacteria bacterium]|nr:hypothetical protein [Gammaproteobacteria bacterium]